MSIPVDSAGILEFWSIPVDSGGFWWNRWRNKKYCFFGMSAK
jgi:hypothetical protein